MRSEGPEFLKAEIPISSDWHSIDVLRRTVTPYVSVVFDDTELCERASTIVGELVENAVKYGFWEGGDPSAFRLRMRGTETHLRIEVTNPVENGAASIKELVGLVEWINRFPSPKDAYMTRLVEVANRAFTAGQSGLGLVRLAYEAGCRLEVDLLSEGRVVSITGVVERAVEAAQATKDLERLLTGDLEKLDLSISCSEDPHAPVKIVWRGRAVHERPSVELEPIVASMIADVTPHDRPLELYIAELEDLSSNSAAVLLEAAHRLLERGRKLIIVHDPDRRWQRMTFECLRRAGSSLGKLEFRTPPTLERTGTY